MTNIARKRRRSKSMSREEQAIVLEKAKRIIDFVFAKYGFAKKSILVESLKQG